MSTTVIASRHGAALYLAPWLPGAVDLAAVRKAAAAHGVELFDAEQLNSRLESIVATGLEPGRAARLAAALRAEGLTVRVVNDPTISRSMRLGNAVAAQFLAAILLVPLVIPAILPALNALFVLASGLALPVIGAPSARPAIAEDALERLRALGEQLPAHVLDPILAKAEELAHEATRDPSGPAVRALEELVEDLDADGGAEVEQTARSLRADLARARRAAREVS